VVYAKTSTFALAFAKTLAGALKKEFF